MREIIQRPDPILNLTCEPVTDIDGLVKEIAGDMIFYLQTSNFIGLAAIQLGEKTRIIAVRRGAYPKDIIIIINPVIIKVTLQTHRVVEGCASIRHGQSFYKVTRHKSVRVVGLDLHGEKVVYKGWDLFGQVLQHEIDHLDGRMIDTHGKLVEER